MLAKILGYISSYDILIFHLNPVIPRIRFDQQQRGMRSLGWQEPFQLCQFEVTGQAFLYHQVRCMMAILFLIGQGMEKPEVIDELLNIEKNPQKPQYR